MELDYIIYTAVIVIAIAFVALGSLAIDVTKRKWVNNTVDKLSDKIEKKTSVQELEKIKAYLEKNKKYLASQTYKAGLIKIEKLQKHMA